MLQFQNKLKKWEGINKMELIDRGYSDEMVDFLDKLLQRAWIKRLTVRSAWQHPWLQRNKTKISKIPRVLAVESTLAYLSHSYTQSKIFSITAYYITRFCMSRE